MGSFMFVSNKFSSDSKIKPSSSKISSNLKSLVTSTSFLSLFLESNSDLSLSSSSSSYIESLEF